MKDINQQNWQENGEIVGDPKGGSETTTLKIGGGEHLSIIRSLIKHFMSRKLQHCVLRAGDRTGLIFHQQDHV